MQYPQDLDGSGAPRRQIIAGFHWDAMQLLQAAHGTDEGTLITARTGTNGRMLLQPAHQPDQVLATFVADDDNGNLTTARPTTAIAEAAENHNYIVRPRSLVGLFVYHDNVPYQTNDGGQRTEVRCTAQSLGGGEVDPSSFVLNYRVDGGAWASWR